MVNDETALAFEALADPIRRRILSVLSEVDECNAGSLADHITTVGRTAVSTHLRVLKLAGLITERKQGRNRFYSVNSTGSAAQVLDVLQELFQSSLTPVRSAVESELTTRSTEAQ